MANEKVSGSIKVHNKISESFTQLHVDGAFGGITPRGLLNVNFFAERFPIPKSSDFALIDANIVGPLIANSEDSKQGIIREFHFGIYMTVETARAFVQLIDRQLRELEGKQNVNDEPSTKNSKD